MNDAQTHPYFPESTFDWRETVRSWRLRQGMTQAALAERSGLALPSIRAYERGKRHPSQTALLSIVGALGIPREEANNVLMGAGYAVDWQGILRQDFVPFRLDELQSEADALPWPAYITNQSYDIIHANRVAELVFQIEVGDFSGFGDRNILGNITHEAIAARVDNWDEVVTFICGLAKGDSEWASADLSNPAPYSRRPVERLAAGDPARVQRFAELWAAAPPIPNRIRHAFTLCIRHPAGILSFSARLILADIVTGIHWNECVPSNAKTWRLLEQITGM